MTQPTQLSQKVNSTTLDTMYNNFIKMTDWLIHGKKSQHPMPATYQALFDTVDLVQSLQHTITEQNNIIGSLQQRMAYQDGRIAALEDTLQRVNHALTQLLEVSNTKVQPSSQIQVTTHTITQEESALVDLGTVTDEAPQQATQTNSQVVSPNEQAIKVSAAAVGAGNIDPASYAALDDEINALLK